mgnify:CR=1 FL=1
MVPTDHAARLQRVRLALDGLSLGDGFGQHFFAPELWRAEFNSRELPPAPWKYTDDTEMALAIADVLAECHAIDQDLLAFEEIWAAAGHPNMVFRLRPDDLVRMTSGRVAPVAR